MKTPSISDEIGEALGSITARYKLGKIDCPTFLTLATEQMDKIRALETSLRDTFATAALQGELAAQSEEYGFVDEFVHPETGGPVIGRGNCFAVSAGNGMDIPYTYDFTKPLSPVLKCSAEQVYAAKAYRIADAMMAERSKP